MFHQKSSEKASHYRTQGNKLFQGKKYQQSLECYTQSMQFALCDSNSRDDTLALAYGNRSAALFHLNRYQDCLVDIERAERASFPPNSRYKLHMRRCLCFVKLGLKSEAHKELAVLHQLANQARQDRDKMAENLERDIRLIEKELAMLRDKQSECHLTVDAESDRRPLPEVSYGPNSVLVQATSALEMKITPEQGRFLQAKQPIRSGDTLIIERPFAGVLLPDHYSTHCHHCFDVLPFNPVGCLLCSHVLYCNEDCQDEAWAVYHHVECPYLDLLHSVGIAHLSLRIVLTAGLDFLPDFLHSHRKHQNTVPGLNEQGRYERNYMSVYDLMTHVEDMQQEDLFQYSLTASLLLAILVHSGCLGETDDRMLRDGDSTVLEESWEHKFARLKNFLQRKAWGAECVLKSETGNKPREKAELGAQSENVHTPLSETKGKERAPKETERRYVSSSQGCSDSVSACGDGMPNIAAQQETVVQLKKTRCLDPDDVLHIGGILLRHVLQLVCNAHAITAVRPAQTKEEVAVEMQSQVRIATAIYPTASLMNHSCDPTIISSFIKDVLIVKSVKEVPAGGEIFNCYGPHWKRMKKSERQEILKNQYFFDCHCEACAGMTDDLSLCDSLRCQHCGSSVPISQKVSVCTNCHVTCDTVAILPQLESADSLFGDGVQSLENGDHQGALASFQSCLRLREQVLASDHRDLGQTYDALAQCLALSGRYQEAAQHLSGSVRVTEAMYGASSIEVARELHKMAEVQVNAGRPREALLTASRALKLARVHCAESDEWVQELLCLEMALAKIVADGDKALG